MYVIIPGISVYKCMRLHTGSAYSYTYRPRGVLVAHLAEHRRAVTSLALAAGGALLLSGSADATVKVGQEP